MSGGVQAVSIHKLLVLDKRENSDNWYARLSLADGGNIRLSTKTATLELTLFSILVPQYLSIKIKINKLMLKVLLSMRHRLKEY